MLQRVSENISPTLFVYLEIRNIKVEKKADKGEKEILKQIQRKFNKYLLKRSVAVSFGEEQSGSSNL